MQYKNFFLAAENSGNHSNNRAQKPTGERMVLSRPVASWKGANFLSQEPHSPLSPKIIVVPRPHVG